MLLLNVTAKTKKTTETKDESHRYDNDSELMFLRVFFQVLAYCWRITCKRKRGPVWRLTNNEKPQSVPQGGQLSLNQKRLATDSCRRPLSPLTIIKQKIRKAKQRLPKALCVNAFVLVCCRVVCVGCISTQCLTELSGVDNYETASCRS